jgi:hypothetical protein
MISIEKRTIKISLIDFKVEIGEMCNLIKKHSPNQIGISIKSLNSHFGLKLKITDFYFLSNELGYKVRRGKFWYFDEMNLPEQKQI